MVGRNIIKLEENEALDRLSEISGQPEFKFFTDNVKLDIAYQVPTKCKSVFIKGLWNIPNPGDHRESLEASVLLGMNPSNGAYNLMLNSSTQNEGLRELAKSQFGRVTIYEDSETCSEHQTLTKEFKESIESYAPVYAPLDEFFKAASPSIVQKIKNYLSRFLG